MRTRREGRANPNRNPSISSPHSSEDMGMIGVERYCDAWISMCETQGQEGRYTTRMQAVISSTCRLFSVLSFSTTSQQSLVHLAALSILYIDFPNTASLGQG